MRRASGCFFIEPCLYMQNGVLSIPVQYKCRSHEDVVSALDDAGQSFAIRSMLIGFLHVLFVTLFTSEIQELLGLRRCRGLANTRLGTLQGHGDRSGEAFGWELKFDLAAKLPREVSLQ
jgi:hypothetical protein